MNFKEFTGKVKQRVFDLILECISFKFLMFILIVGVVKSANVPYVSDIIPIVAGGGTLAYKAFKENNQKQGIGQ